LPLEALAMTTRRLFLQYASAGLGALAAEATFPAFAADSRPLDERIAGVCRRLAPLGWRQLLLDATGGELDIGAADLKSQLLKPLGRIDRAFPGFGDFSLMGSRAVEPRHPDQSLLYHALASPTVIAGRDGKELQGFPTLPEIEAVEDFIYGVAAPTIEQLRTEAAGHRLGIAVFAAHYRNAPDSVNGRHAELCFARTGIARLGTTKPLYDGKSRNFTGTDATDPFAFRAVPQRYVAYVAAHVPGTWSNFGPQDALLGDAKLNFWVPLHKLFAGKQCVAGLDLDLTFTRGLVNDGLARFHRFLEINGLQNNFSGSDLEEYPFVIRDDKIASLSEAESFGPGVLVPRLQPLASVAEYKGKKLTFPVDGSYSSDISNFCLGSLQLLPLTGAAQLPHYMNDAAQSTQRGQPEYINIRHRVNKDGSVDNLNHDPKEKEILMAGGYEALHYYDGVGDGWVEASCPALAGLTDENVPAYSMVGPPDFFPKVKQRNLMRWWESQVPEPIRAALWVVPPLALSQTRNAANINLPIGFAVTDTTVTALVAQPKAHLGPPQQPNGRLISEKTGLPDGSPGLFDPGWDISQGIHFTDPSQPLQKFLAGYGLGSPFIDDAKLCAALGAYWPGVSPDSTRAFPPNKVVDGIDYPYPTIVPLTDEEIGMVPDPTYGKPMPWDGMPGPKVVEIGAFRYAEYMDPWRVDYIDLLGTMTAALTSKIDMDEYTSRIMAMEAVYWSLGIHDADFTDDPPNPAGDPQTAPEKVIAAKATWAVLSFRKLDGGDQGFAEARRQAGAPTLDGPSYYFHVFRWGREAPSPDDIYHVRVEMLEEAKAYVIGTRVLLQRVAGAWTIDASMPT
jgi:hypothetical protein